MTIESHYNKLLRRSQAPLGEIEGWEKRDARMAAEATRLAAEDWIRVRSVYARERLEIPNGPLVVGWESVFRRSDGSFYDVRDSARKAVEPDYLALAWRSLTPQFEREKERAEQEFEAYRQAVMQGVAIPPQEDAK